MNYELMQNNRVCLTGTVVEEPKYSHNVLGEGFYDVELDVKRLSGQIDRIPLTVSERLMTDGTFIKGNTVGVMGQLRSYNKLIEGRSKLVLKVFVREISAVDEDEPNTIELEGFLCKPTVFRTTPFNREIADMLIAVNRSYNKSDYIPVIAWGRNAKYADGFSVGSKIHLVGRIQSRTYQKQLEGGEVEERVAYEVSVTTLDLVKDEIE